MTKLTAAEVKTCVNLTVNDDTAAYTCAERDNDYVLIALACTVYNLAVCGNVSVVFNENVLAESFL